MGSRGADARVLKKARYVLGDVLGVLRELERDTTDVFGRFQIEPGQEVDLDRLGAFLELAIADSPSQTLVITVRALQGQRGVPNDH